MASSKNFYTNYFDFSNIVFNKLAKLAEFEFKTVSKM